MGTRISEESHLRPKPMVEIGGMPILWHIMKIYSHYEINEFIVCLGYKGYQIKEFFAHYFLHMSDVTFDMRKNEMEVHQQAAEPWKVTLVNTGIETMTGGRIKQIQQYVADNTFCLTYGDGLSDLNISDLIQFHRSHGNAATVTAIQPPGRFGSINIEGDTVAKFVEKPVGHGSWINGGFFVLEPEIFDHIDSNETIWEQEPLQYLAKNRKLFAYKHDGFWYCMDTLRDKNHLESLWKKGNAPWKVW